MNVQQLVPPEIGPSTLEEFLRRNYGLTGEWTRLDGERDQNFHIRDESGRDWTFKVCNDCEPADIFACQALALEHIAATDPSLPVPRLRRTASGELLPMLKGPDGRVHPVLLLSYLPGKLIGNRSLTEDQLYSLGSTLARLGRALRGFIHHAPASRDLIWDNRLAPRLLDRLDVITGSERALAQDVLMEFRDHTLSRLATLRSQVIHGDVHPYNALLDSEGHLSGIIDFGDMVHGALVQDLANTLADMLDPDRDFGEIIFPLVSGYRSVTPLEEGELDVLFSLMDVRLAMTPVITALRNAQHAPQISYLAAFGDRSFALLGKLRGSDRQDLENLARRAAAFPARHKGAAVSTDDLLTRRRRVLGDRLYLFYDPPVHMVRGEGVWLTDAAGRRYLDCYNNVPHVGHCHPYVTEAISRQARTLNTNTRYVGDAAVEYAERLVATAHPGLSAVLYVNSGSEANDVAWRLAKAWTGNSGGLCMDFAYHGITDAVDCFSPSNAPDQPSATHIRLIPPPDDYRGPYRRGEPDLMQRYAALVDEPISSLKQSGHGVAACMIDSAFMTNGMLDVPHGYVQAICDKVRAAGGLFIADEVQSGFGRMGSAMWGHQHHGVVPDFITIGKPAGNGHPIGVVLTRPEILEHFTRTASFFSTFGGNNVSCAAGLAVLDVIRDEKLIENAHEAGNYLRNGLRNLMAEHPLIGDVRGVGLAVGIELVRDRRTLEPAPREATRLLSLVRDEGVLVGGEGKLGNIVKIRPPIVFRKTHADIAIAAISRALSRLAWECA
jgi:4-aminobutyrate aminotransferase-like enzyme